MRVEDVEFYEDCGVLQPPRRQVGRGGNRAFHQEHVERLHYIKRALGCGLTIDDVQALLDPAAMLTAGDVYEVVRRRLSNVRQAEHTEEWAAHALEKLLETCPRTGSRRHCNILKTLTSSG
jgi:MerR family transcriptional regulator, mercuric resistance operon regulatory protein